MRRNLTLILVLMAGAAPLGAAPARPFDLWYAIGSKGLEAGYAHQWLKKGVWEGQEAWEMGRESQVRFNAVIFKIDVVQEERAWLDGNGRLLGFARSVRNDKGLTRSSGRVRGGRLQVSLKAPDRQMEFAVPLKDYDYTGWEQDWMLLTGQIAALQQAGVIRLFETDSLSIQFGTIRDQGRQKSDDKAIPGEVRVVERWFNRYPQTLWLDAENRKVKEFSPDFSITLARKDRIQKKHKLD